MLIRSGMGMQLSGSVGGVVAARNAGGAYLRNRTVPVNPNSVRQQASRSVFATAATVWRGLTVAERGAWDAYAVESPVLNRLGESITISGFSHYVRTNAFRFAADALRLDVAPVTPGESTLGELNSVAFSVSTGLTIVSATPTAVGPGIVQVGPPVSAGVSFFKGPFTLLFSGVFGDSLLLDEAPTELTPRYGTWLLGQRRFIRIRGSDVAGRISNSAIRVVTAVA